MYLALDNLYINQVTINLYIKQVTIPFTLSNRFYHPIKTPEKKPPSRFSGAVLARGIYFRHLAWTPNWQISQGFTDSHRPKRRSSTSM